MNHRFRVYLTLLIIASFGAQALFAEVGQKVLVSGKVIDYVGKPVENYYINFIVEREVIDLSNFKKSISKRKVFTTQTDRDGVFFFTWNTDNYFNKFYLEYYVKDNFDDARFIPPKENLEDVSRSVAKGRNYEGKLVLTYHKDWFRVKSMIDLFGIESDKGKMLRKWGLYERETKDDISDVIYTFWWYYSKGKAFKFKENRLVKEFTYSPLRPI